MLVSVIIPCYNYGNFLAQAVESVLDQTHRDLECLIVDDGSKDHTAAVAKSIEEKDPRVKYYYKPNGGLSSARNFGIEKCRGDLVCFLDADDLLDREKLQQQITVFEREPAVSIVYGRCMFFKNENRTKLFPNKDNSNMQLPALSGRGRDLLPALVSANITVISAPTMRRQVFESVGVFDPAYRSYEDWHFWIRCALADLVFIFCEAPAVCTYIRFGHESMMSDKRKLVLAGIQIRRYLSERLGGSLWVYNFYRLMRSRIKLLLL